LPDFFTTAGSGALTGTDAELDTLSDTASGSGDVEDFETARGKRGDSAGLSLDFSGTLARLSRQRRRGLLQPLGRDGFRDALTELAETFDDATLWRVFGEGKALISGAAPLGDFLVDIDELATELVFKARATSGTGCGSDGGTVFESVTQLLLSAGAFGRVSAAADAPRGFLIRACGLVHNVLLGLIARITAATHTLGCLLISTLFGARLWLGSGVTAATDALGSLLIGACGVVHGILLGLISARDGAADAGTSAGRRVIIVSISARATIVVIVTVTAAAPIIVVVIASTATATTTAGWRAGDGTTETGTSAGRWVIIVTISARATIVIVIIAATTATTTGIETIVAGATDGATRAITVTFSSASFSCAHAGIIG